MEALRLSKILSLKDIERQTTLGWNDPTPAPFPGRWPTRIAWRSGPGYKQTYLGKPAPQHVHRFLQLYQKWGGVLIEFDRLHRPVFRHSLFDGTSAHRFLFPYYHYWIPADSQCSHLLGHHGTKQIDGHVVYTPWIALHDTRRAEWRAFQAFSGVKLT